MMTGLPLQKSVQASFKTAGSNSKGWSSTAELANTSLHFLHSASQRVGRIIKVLACVPYVDIRLRTSSRQSKAAKCRWKSSKVSSRCCSATASRKASAATVLQAACMAADVSRLHCWSMSLSEINLISSASRQDRADLGRIHRELRNHISKLCLKCCPSLGQHHRPLHRGPYHLSVASATMPTLTRSGAAGV